MTKDGIKRKFNVRKTYASIDIKTQFSEQDAKLIGLGKYFFKVCCLLGHD